MEVYIGRSLITKWNDAFATTFEELKLTDTGETIEKKRKLKYGGILVQYKDLKTGKPKVAIYRMETHSDGTWGIMPTDYYEPWGPPKPAICEDSLVARWNELNAAKKKEAGKRKCEADRAARHGKKQHFQI